MILAMTHIATDIPVEIQLDLVEQTFAKDKNLYTDKNGKDYKERIKFLLKKNKLTWKLA